MKVRVVSKFHHLVDVQHHGTQVKIFESSLNNLKLFDLEIFIWSLKKKQVLAPAERCGKGGGERGFASTKQLIWDPK